MRCPAKIRVQEVTIASGDMQNSPLNAHNLEPVAALHMPCEIEDNPPDESETMHDPSYEPSDDDHDDHVYGPYGDASQKLKTRRRQRHSDMWKRNKNKQHRNSGKEYVSRSGRKIPAREFGPPCTCRRKCFLRI